ncbi:MAG: discoidin domain-containing protein, partial [Planctomycetota bacterium]
IQEIFEEEFAGADSPAKKVALAKTLHKQAQASADDPDSRFVLLSEACDLSARAGDVSGAMQMVDAMQRDYEIKPLSVKVFVLKTAIDSMPSGSSARTVGQGIADAAMVLANRYAGQNDYETASGFAELAMDAAKKTKDASLIQPLTARQREINRMKARFASIEKARDALSVNPDDPAANLTAGRWFCFTRDDWAKGLPLLVKGEDAALAEVAKKEIAAPTDPSAQVALADGWYEQAENEKDEVKSAVQSRATFWYNQAFPSLEGLEKVKVKKRLEAIAEAEVATSEPEEPKKPAIERGVVQPGNVALATNGTTVIGPASGASYLIDGGTSSGYAYSPFPCEWTITFDKVYRLQAIAFQLRGSSSSQYYRYAVAISADGEKYFPLANCSQGQWRGLQKIRVPNRPVKSIKLFGLYNNYNSYFYVTEFEAYCVVPR